MLTVSISQVVGLWSELEECFRDENSYNGTEAEIYAYTLGEELPGYKPWCKNGRPMDSMLAEDGTWIEENRKKNLVEICELFAKRKACKVMIKLEDRYVTPKTFLKKGLTLHRDYVKVTKIKWRKKK